ncbi:hypothetical protein [Thiolapillus sp.]
MALRTVRRRNPVARSPLLRKGGVHRSSETKPRPGRHQLLRLAMEALEEDAPDTTCVTSTESP